MDSKINTNSVKSSTISYNLTDAEKLDLIIERLFNGIQKAFCVRCGISETTPANWRKRNRMDYRKVSKGCRELSLAWLINGEGPMLLADLECPEPGTPIEEERTPTHVEQPSSDAQIYKVAEGESVDRALLNMLLHEKTTMMQELAILRQRNLELEKQNAVMADRLDNAEKWYYAYAANKKD